MPTIVLLPEEVDGAFNRAICGSETHRNFVQQIAALGSRLQAHDEVREGGEGLADPHLQVGCDGCRVPRRSRSVQSDLLLDERSIGLIHGVTPRFHHAVEHRSLEGGRQGSGVLGAIDGVVAHPYGRVWWGDLGKLRRLELR